MILHGSNLEMITGVGIVLAGVWIYDKFIFGKSFKKRKKEECKLYSYGNPKLIGAKVESKAVNIFNSDMVRIVYTNENGRITHNEALESLAWQMVGKIPKENVISIETVFVDSGFRITASFNIPLEVAKSYNE